MKHRTFSVRVGFVLFMLALLAYSRDVFPADAKDAIHVSAPSAQPSDWSADRLAKELAGEMQTVQFTSRGKPHSAKCVSLVALLKASGVQTDLKMDPKADPKIKNFPLRMAVVVTGRDGYVASFGLGELISDVGHTEAWLAVEVDGQPLPATDGPARLIVPSDGKPARWVRQVGSISVIDGAAATTQPK